MKYSFIKGKSHKEETFVTGVYNEISGLITQGDPKQAVTHLRCYMLNNRPDMFEFMDTQGPIFRGVFRQAKADLVPAKVTRKSGKVEVVLKTKKAIEAYIG